MIAINNKKEIYTNFYEKIINLDEEESSYEG